MTSTAVFFSGTHQAPIVAPRTYRSNMCGVRVQGLAPVAGGAADPSLVLSWFYDRYDAVARTLIRSTWKDRGCVDVLLSWPDSQAAGQSPAQFNATCQELVSFGFQPQALRPNSLCSRTPVTSCALSLSTSACVGRIGLKPSHGLPLV